MPGGVVCYYLAVSRQEIKESKVLFKCRSDEIMLKAIDSHLQMPNNVV